MGRLRTVSRLTVATAFLLVTAAVPAFAQPTTTPFSTPDPSACPYRATPPPPVDLSELPVPGRATPTPLPVRPTPVGGGRLDECGIVLPAGAGPLPDGLSATSWLLADLDSGAVLATMDPHGRHRPASTVKVLTALLALRELELTTEVVGTDADAAQEGSRVGIGPTGRYTVEQLLYGLLLRSGNDAAHALAVQLGGVPATVLKMNGLARELGALDTRVATPSGLDGPGSSVSAYDLALLFRVAMRDPRFAAMVGTSQIDFPGFMDKPGFKVGNDNRLLMNYPGALGGKTGFTDDARHTYVGAAQRGERRLLVVLLRGEQLPVRMWEQAARLLDYGFALPATVGPVGSLVESAPPLPTSGPAASASASTAGAAAAAPDGDGTVVVADGVAATAPGDRAAVYLAALVAVAVALGALVWFLRRRRPTAQG
jgi:serine-type D-Ala-D-Ala carboxypeptidase (penicillin-binding protein 5/6)